MLLLTMIIYGIAASAASHSVILLVGKSEEKRKKKKKAQGFDILSVISLAVFKMLLTQITPIPTPLLAHITSAIKLGGKKKN